MRQRPFQVTVVLATLALLCACGRTGLPGRATATSPLDALEAQELAEELKLGDAPTTQVVVPSRPVRQPAPPTSGNATKAYVSPAETLPALLALIDGAERSIYLETFNFGNDSYGQQLVPRLIAKAQAGVEVRVVMDYVGSRFLKDHRALVRALRTGGVDVRRYMPRGIQHDDGHHSINIQHRKVYIADNQRALVGGVNLMHEFDTIHQDILVAFEGPVVADLHREFVHDYRAAGGKAPIAPLTPAAGTGTTQAQVTVTSPTEGRFESRDAIYAGIDAAERTIAIENQYLWDDRLIKRLYGALARGVKVRVMVPGEEHKKIFKNIHSEELRRLVEQGAEARTYKGQPEDAHLHVKFYSVDDRWTAIGSANGDTRAYLDNQELQVVMVDPQLAVDLRERLFERDWAERSAPFVYKPSNMVTKPFRRLLEVLDYYL